MRRNIVTAAMAPAAVLLGTTILLGQTSRIVPPAPPPGWESCEEMHDTYVARFESAAGFGMSRMGQPPMLDRSGVLDTGRAHYAIETLELIGQLKQETPVVYLLGQLKPDMSVVSLDRVHGARPRAPEFTSRPLTDFEKRALAAFHTGTDIVTTDRDQAGTLRCAGALRAKASCITCHKDRQAGDLLGAFTYTLRLR